VADVRHPAARAQGKERAGCVRAMNGI
jgi:hypothetical protein